MTDKFCYFWDCILCSLNSLRIDCIYFTERGHALAWFLISLIQRELAHQNPEAFEHEREILEQKCFIAVLTEKLFKQEQKSVASKIFHQKFFSDCLVIFPLKTFHAFLPHFWTFKSKILAFMAAWTYHCIYSLER